jgi:5-methylcytosine-specific restriction endonuclease McrA
MLLKEKILELKSKGLSQSEIVEKLGCAKSTVCWHFNPEKQLKKAQDRKKKIPDYEIKNCRNVSRFFCSKTENKQPRKIKDLTFSQAHVKNRERLKNFSKHYKSNTMEQKTKIKYVKEKYNITESNTTFTCRYTAKILDWTRPEEYQYDHIIPRSRGGKNTLENLQIISKEANQAKGDMTHEEFVNFIKLVNGNLAL